MQTAKKNKNLSKLNYIIEGSKSNWKEEIEGSGRRIRNKGLGGTAIFNKAPITIYFPDNVIIIIFY